MKPSKNNNGDFALLIIDVQQKIINPIKNHNLIISNIELLLRSYEILRENIFLSEQNPLKLGPTLKNLLPNKEFKKIEKMRFSLAFENHIINSFSANNIKSLIICGFESHICIQQSVLDFLQEGYKVYVIADAIGSRNINDHKISLDRMSLEGATITTTESIIFELCETSSRKEFKSISNLIKNKLYK
tara:strand:+ start:144 stop:707 length:564 start_codon:yes stop_codon:yes gene_type:complete